MSTQTEHIGLHQWESTDSFLREDFNEDNRRIDAAVGAVEEALSRVKLSQIVTQQDAQQVDVDLTGIDFSCYWEVELRLEGSLSKQGGVNIRLNGAADSNAYEYISSSGNSYQQSYLGTLYLGYPGAEGRYNGGKAVLYCGPNYVSALCENYGSTNSSYRAYATSYSGVTFENLSVLNLIAGSGTIDKGAVITIYGVKR